MTDQLDTNQVATLIGVAPGRVRSMLAVARCRRAAGLSAVGHIPEPDGRLGGVWWWRETTIAEWLPTRLGVGSRTNG